MTSPTDNQRTGWIDLLRVVACILVVFAHCCDSFIGAFDSDFPAFLAGTAMGSLSRPSVPLFVIMTGILLLPLPSGSDATAFYRKRIGRILPPLIFWSVALPVLFYIYFGHVNPESANPMVDTAAYTISNVWRHILLMAVNFNFNTVPLWYLYMLIGLYLIMPLISPWLRAASRNELRTVLRIWGVTLFLPYLRLFAPQLGYEGNFGNMDILGACDWNAYGTFYYLSGFIGYLLLAYYVTTWPPKWSARRTAAICATMFAAGYAATFGGFVAIQQYFPGDYSYLEIIWYFCGINVFMMTYPVLVVFSRLRFTPPAWLATLSKLTFGIYLCHFIFVYISFDLFDIESVNPFLRIIGMTAASFTCAAILTAILRLTPLTRRFIA